MQTDDSPDPLSRTSGVLSNPSHVSAYLPYHLIVAAVSLQFDHNQVIRCLIDAEQVDTPKTGYRQLTAIQVIALIDPEM